MANYKVGTITKQTIFLASKKLFYEKGYTGTKVTDILNEAEAKISSFYHHYTDKSELGLYVYLGWGECNRKISTLFIGRADKLMRLCIEFRVYWRMFFRDEHLRRFAVELTQNRLTHQEDYTIVYDMLKKVSNVSLSEKELKLISVTRAGMNDMLMYHAYQNIEEFTSNEISDYSTRALFTMFRIPEEKIDEILKKSKALFDELILENNGFDITGYIKSN